MDLVLQKSLLAAELLAQGIPTLTAACVADAPLAHFIGVLTRLRQRHAALLQPKHFSGPRNLSWHGAQWGGSSLVLHCHLKALEVMPECAWMWPDVDVSLAKVFLLLYICKCGRGWQAAYGTTWMAAVLLASLNLIGAHRAAEQK